MIDRSEVEEALERWSSRSVDPFGAIIALALIVAGVIVIVAATLPA